MCFLTSTGNLKQIRKYYCTEVHIENLTYPAHQYHHPQSEEKLQHLHGPGHRLTSQIE